MSISSAILFCLLFVLGYLVAPTMLVWGWKLWIKQRPRLWTISSTLSFIGFVLGSFSALFALWIIVYSSAGGFQHSSNISYDSLNYSFFYQCVLCGSALSVLGIAFAVGGVWRKSQLRWQALASTVGTLAFWLLATTWP
jgi:hypothetical protein